MSTLEGLPAETLLSILRLLADEASRGRHMQQKALDLDISFDYAQNQGQFQARSLSHTSKRVNSVCQDVIFQSYRVCLDRPIDDVAPGSIAHAMSKKHSIRRLVIQHGIRGFGTSKPEILYSPEILAKLVDLLHAVSERLTVVLISDKGGSMNAFDSATWETILSMPNMRQLGVCSCVIPADLTTHIQLDALAVKTSPERPNILLDLVRAKSLQLEMLYPLGGTISPYVPHDPLIEEIKVLCRIPHQHCATPPLDFTLVPQASVRVDFWIYVEIKAHIPRFWKEARTVLPTLIAGFDRFDVRRAGASHTHAIVERPSVVDNPDFRPTRADHIANFAHDQKEQEMMTAYYQSKAARSDYLR